MNLSAGWLWLLGGIYSAIKNAIASKFYKSDFDNQGSVIPDEDRTIEVPVSRLQRWAIVTLCVLVAIVGIWLIQRDGNWNPFQGAMVTQPWTFR